MASDFFRIDRGLIVDELAQVTNRAGTPISADEISAKIGSLFLQTDAATNQLNIWYKFKDDAGTIADWAQLASKTYADSTASASSFTISGDVTGTINGGVDVLTLANVNASVGTYGSGTQVPVITVNAKGLVTSVTTTAVTGGGTALVLYSENPSAPTNASSPGLNAVAIGFGSEASATKSLAIGEQALTRIPGSVVVASGRFGTQGDAQVGKYLVRATTPGNAPTELLVDGTGGSTRLVLPDDATWTFRATVTGHETTPGNGHAGFEITGVIYRGSGAGTIAFQGAPNVSVIGRSSTAWKAAVAVDTVNGALKISVTGQSGKTIRWLAHVETVEVTN